jgi:phosphatidylethanolamine-binding protein (PEBP) family uncharacterized protein
VLAVVAFALAGCGGGSSGDTGSTTASSGASGAQTETETRQAPSAPSNGSAHESEPPAETGRHGPPVPVPSGEEEHKITPQQRREATVANITLESPSSPSAARGTSALSAKYTCDGTNTSPALRWQGVPSGTKELTLFAMNIQPVEGKLFFDWAVAGLDPALEEIKAGALPAGAIVGRNSFGKVGYEICPTGAGETYMFALFALPKELSPANGFDPFALRKAVAGVSGNAGLLGMSYARG